jgi:pilus assembly protein CpaC
MIMKLNTALLALSLTTNAIGSDLAATGLKADNAINKAAISVSVNGSTVLDESVGIRRISIANADIAEAVAVSTNEIVVNGKTAGDTSLIVWDLKGNRSMLDVHVVANTSKIDSVRAELLKEAGADVTIDAQEGTVFLNGTVANETSALRAFNIASTMGKVVNLLRVNTPAAEPQILLKVRFADIDRTAASQFALNLFQMSNSGIGTSTTGQFGQNPTFNTTQNSGQNTTTWNLSNLLNIFYFKPSIDLGAVLQDLESHDILQILAEPNLLTMSGKSASFLAGGEFPFPTIQGGASGVGQITIQFKEFGVRLNFTPVVTPRGTIRLTVTPEVSSLDYANGLSVSGYTVPGLSTRRVQTEIELENGQSFVIAGLLNNQVTDSFSKMPGFANVPILGKLFQSKSVSKSSSELLIMVTPELVNPLPAAGKTPEMAFPKEFLKDAPTHAPQQPSDTGTGNTPLLIKRDVVPIEELLTTPQGTTSSNMTPPASNSPGANNLPGANGMDPTRSTGKP